MDEGAFGLSVGLEYPLGAARHDRRAGQRSPRRPARRGGLFAIHTRDRDFRAVEAFDEAFAVAERSGAAVPDLAHPPRAGARPTARCADVARADRPGAGGRASTSPATSTPASTGSPS